MHRQGYRIGKASLFIGVFADRPGQTSTVQQTGLLPVQLTFNLRHTDKEAYGSALLPILPGLGLNPASNIYAVNLQVSLAKVILLI